MIFEKININNFKQYYGEISIDLSPNSEQNIILIGGKNGYGKTNFLIALVWCLYGDNLSKIDNNFRKEINKEKNYQSFMKKSLNWDALKENETEFSVSIIISNLKIEINSSKIEKIIIKRVFDIHTMQDELKILDFNSKKPIDIDTDDQINFIEDFIIPLSAAKFVFFDAEKISEIANLSLKQEGHFINDALNKILGLDLYSSLAEDFETYSKKLMKESAKKQIQEQITNTESAIELHKIEEEECEKNIDEIEEKILEKTSQISDINNIISQYNKGKSSDNSSRVQELDNEIENLNIEIDKSTNKFNDFSEEMPFYILTGKLEEIRDHLDKQTKNTDLNNASNEFKTKIDSFVQKLFREPDYPTERMSLVNEMFYYQKAQELVQTIFNSEEEIEQLDFEHDLNSADKNLIEDAINLVNHQSNSRFDEISNYLNKNIIERNSKVKEKSILLSNAVDDTISEFIQDKNNLQKEIKDLLKEQGENEQKKKSKKEITQKLNNQLSKMLTRIKISFENEKKIKLSKNYVKSLNQFVSNEKERHRSNLEKSILKELQNLMHKLNEKDSKDNFIQNVKVNILPSNLGMSVKLIGQEGEEILKENLSSGEKQIYISSLIKAIISESSSNYPIFIDTPLGRLDREHREKIIKKYYPYLANQVVLFSTNSEITTQRYNEIKNKISKAYKIVNDGKKSNITEGYFN